MQTQLNHLQINVRPDNLPFYRDLLGFLGWQTLYSDDGMFGAGDPNGASLWFVGQAKDVANDYDGPGTNHIAIKPAEQGDVDAVAGFLKQRKVEALFETPRHRPEFAEGEGKTYYQVMFESPDRVLFEVVYTGPKAA
jgi:catechol 2,3-dioxygenase-like lactoylglutathione lyase family enzyme